MATTTNLITAEEFSELGDLGRPAELVRGEIVMMTPAGYRHGQVCVKIVVELTNFLRDHPTGTVVSNDTGVITQRSPDTVRGADVAYFSYDRIPKGTAPVGFSSIQPELVFEVKSPSDRWKDLHAKAAEYLQSGVLAVCIVDFETETVVVNHSDKAPSSLTRRDSLTLESILPGFSIPVARFFAD